MGPMRIPMVSLPMTMMFFLTSMVVVCSAASIIDDILSRSERGEPFIHFKFKEDRGTLASQGGGILGNAQQPGKKHILVTRAFSEPSTQNLLLRWKNGTVEATGGTQHVHGAFSVGHLHGIIGEFSEDELSLLSAHHAVHYIEEDSTAEIALGEELMEMGDVIGYEQIPVVEEQELAQVGAHPEYKCLFGSQLNPPNWGLAALSGYPLRSFKYPICKGSHAKIYVIDTGIDASLPSFNARVLPGWSIFESKEQNIIEDSSIVDQHGHGTHVAGIIAGEECGVAKEATLISVRVFREGTGPVSNVIAGLAWILSNRKKEKKTELELVNLSITSAKSAILNAMLESAYKANLLVISAAGNQGSNACNVSPAASAPWILSVGAFCENRKIAPFSNRGERCVHIFAPGCDIFSLAAGAPGALLPMNGTSMAAPHVTGVAALLISTPWIKGRVRTPEDMRRTIVNELSASLADRQQRRALSIQSIHRFCHTVF